MDIVNNYIPGDHHLIEKIVQELKSQGIFDQFRKECIADVDTKPAYQNLRQRVESNVVGFLTQQKWTSEMNKNQVREMLRKSINESGYLDTGVERIVDQVVNPKITTIFLPKVEHVFYKLLGIEKPSIQKTEPELSATLLSDNNNSIHMEIEAEKTDDSLADTTTKTDSSFQNNFDSVNSTKIDDEESPPFEPLDVNMVSQEDCSVDSHSSITSALTSGGESSQSGKIINANSTDLSNPDSSNLSSKEPEVAKEFSENSDAKITTKENKSSLEKSKHSKHRSSSSSSKSRSKDHKKDKSHSSDRHRSSDKDKNRHRSDDKSDKDKKSKERSEKDKKSRHDSYKEKSDSEKVEKRHRSESEKDKKNDSDKDKSRNDSKDKNKHKKHKDDKHKSDKSHKEKSERDSSSNKDTKDKNKSSSKKEGSSSKSSSKKRERSSESKSKDDSRSKMRKDDKSKTHKDEKRKKVAKDDHYSAKNSKNGRSSSDRDSDGQSNRPEYSSLSKSSGSSKSTQDSKNYSISSGSTSGNSDSIEKSAGDKHQIQKIKFHKPKFALNMKEALKIMKIRKQLKKLEQKNQLNLVDDSEALIHRNKDSAGSISKENTNKNTKYDEISDVEQIVPANLSNIKKETWDELEAKFIQQIGGVDYNSYESPDADDGFEYSFKIPKREKEQPQFKPKNYENATKITKVETKVGEGKDLTNTSLVPEQKVQKTEDFKKKIEEENNESSITFDLKNLTENNLEIKENDPNFSDVEIDKLPKEKLKEEEKCLLPVNSDTVILDVSTTPDVNKEIVEVAPIENEPVKIENKLMDFDIEQNLENHSEKTNDNLLKQKTIKSNSIEDKLDDLKNKENILLQDGSNILPVESDVAEDTEGVLEKTEEIIVNKESNKTKEDNKNPTEKFNIEIIVEESKKTEADINTSTEKVNEEMIIDKEIKKLEGHNNSPMEKVNEDIIKEESKETIEDNNRPTEKVNEEMIIDEESKETKEDNNSPTQKVNDEVIIDEESKETEEDNKSPTENVNEDIIDEESKETEGENYSSNMDQNNITNIMVEVSETEDIIPEIDERKIKNSPILNHEIEEKEAMKRPFILLDKNLVNNYIKNNPEMGGVPVTGEENKINPKENVGSKYRKKVKYFSKKALENLKDNKESVNSSNDNKGKRLTRSNKSCTVTSKPLTKKIRTNSTPPIDDCYGFMEEENEDILILESFIKKIEVRSTLEDNTKNVSEIKDEKRRGRKRKEPVENEVINNENNNVNNKSVVPKKIKDKIINKHSKQDKKEPALDTSGVIMEKFFPLPLSPADSEVSMEKKESQMSTRKGKGKQQRYSSEDLYKPRLSFTTSRRRSNKNL